MLPFPFQLLAAVTFLSFRADRDFVSDPRHRLLTTFLRRLQMFPKIVGIALAGAARRLD